MTVPLLSDLREPPLVGALYMVPVIRDYPWCGHTSNWPVLGPLHDDKDFFNFSVPHYHIDIRFTTARQEAIMLTRGDLQWFSSNADVVAAMGSLSCPLASHGYRLPKGMPGLMRRRCRRASYYCPAEADPIKEMRKKLGDPAEAIRLGDGRLLCPHRKVDLSQFTPDADGIVTCPLHGLRVRCGTSA